MVLKQFDLKSLNGVLCRGGHKLDLFKLEYFDFEDVSSILDIVISLSCSQDHKVSTKPPDPRLVEYSKSIGSPVKTVKSPHERDKD